MQCIDAPLHQLSCKLVDVDGIWECTKRSFPRLVHTSPCVECPIATLEGCRPSVDPEALLRPVHGDPVYDASLCDRRSVRLFGRPLIVGKCSTQLRHQSFWYCCIQWCPQNLLLLRIFFFNVVLEKKSGRRCGASSNHLCEKCAFE